jgi:hypothetical protein
MNIDMNNGITMNVRTITKPGKTNRVCFLLYVIAFGSSASPYFNAWPYETAKQYPIQTSCSLLVLERLVIRGDSFLDTGSHFLSSQLTCQNPCPAAWNNWEPVGCLNLNPARKMYGVLFLGA